MNYNKRNINPKKDMKNMASKKDNKSEEKKNLTPAEQKEQALKAAMQKLEKSFGTGTVMRMGDESRQAVDVISTGSLGLDLALGCGGLPRGRVVEIYGPESSGKTTLALHAMIEAQRQGGTVAMIDAEHAFDRTYAQALGMDTNQLLIAQPDNGEQALEIADSLIRSGAIDVVVVDSVAALTPKAEIEGDMGENKVGLQARLMSQGLRKLTAAVNQTNTLLIFINQLREKIGVMFGNPETTTGGLALKFYASVRLEIRRVTSVKGDGDEILGNQVRVRVVKNKVAPPFRKAEFDLMFGQGIDRVGELLDLGVDLEVLGKSGAFYSFGELKIARGRDASKRALREHPELMADIEARVLEKIRQGTRPKYDQDDHTDPTDPTINAVPADPDYDAATVNQLPDIEPDDVDMPAVDIA